MALEGTSLPQELVVCVYGLTRVMSGLMFATRNLIEVAHLKEVYVEIDDLRNRTLQAIIRDFPSRFPPANPHSDRVILNA